MNTLSKIAVGSAVLLSSAQSFAASDAKLLTQCKQFAQSQVENVERIKSTSIKNRRSGFEAKFKIRTAEGTGLYLCSIPRGEQPSLARLDKPAAAQVAAER